MLRRRSTEINYILFANVGENIFYGGEQAMFISLVMWLYPFPLQYPPKSFGDIEVRGIRRKIKYMEASFLPSLNTVVYLAALVHSGVIQNDHSLLADAKREVLHKLDEPVGVYVLLGSETMIDTIAVNHSEDIESSAFIYGHTEILIFEFPFIRHISFGAYMTFISVIQVNETHLPLMFKLLQEFLLISVLLRRGGSLRTFLYTSKGETLAATLPI